MFRYIGIIGAVICLAFSARVSLAEVTFDSFGAELNRWADSLYGVVDNVSGSRIKVKAADTSGVVNGMVFNVTRPGEELIHPINGKSLGRKTIILGTLTITEIGSNFFSGEFNGATAPVKGDGVSFPMPVGVNFVFNGLADGEKTEASFSLMKGKKIAQADNGDFTLSCTKSSPQGDVVDCNFQYKNTAALAKAQIPVVSVSVADDVALESGKFGEDFISAAIGFAYGVSGGITVAAAEDNSVVIFKYSPSDGFKKAAVIDNDFYNVINVEFADLNNDGRDELFISNVSKTNKSSSHIYEFSDGKFKALETDLPYLFRSYYSAGAKTLVCQQFEDGDFNSRVSRLIYDGTGYTAGEALDSGLGARLYGFAKTSAGETSFDTGGGLLIKDAFGESVRYRGNFGDTPRKLTYTVQELSVAQSGADSGAITNVDERILSVAVYPRILEIARGRYFLAGNVPVTRRTTGNDEYKSSFYGIYTLFGGKSEAFWQESPVEPTVMETDIAVNGDRAFILILQNGDGGLFGGSDSHIKIVSIKLR